MRLIRKTLAVLLAVTMLALSVPFTAMATGDNLDGQHIESVYNVSAVEEPESTEPTISVAKVSGNPGDSVDVAIDIKNNPGITAFLINVEYDEENLTLTKITNGTTLAGPQHNANQLTQNPFIINFADDLAVENNTSNGTVVTLTFAIAEGAEITTAPVTVTYKDADIYDMNMDNVAFEIENGGVQVLGEDFTGLSFTDKKVTYDSEPHSIEVTGVPAGATVTYTSGGDEFDGAEAVGEYEVTATVTAPGYNDWEKTATLEITKKDLTVNVVVPAKEYDGTTTIENYADYVSMTGLIDGDDVELNVSELHYDIPDAVVMQNVIGNVGVNGGDLGNYEVTYNRPQVAITQKPITVKANDVIVRVGADMPAEYAYTATGLVEGDTLREVKVTVSSKANTNTVKEYPITVTVDANYNRNYKVTTAPGIFKVVAKDVQEVNIPTIEGVTYGDDSFNLGVTTGETVTSSLINYSSLTPAVVSVDDEGNVTILAAGTAKIAVTKAGDEIYADVDETVEFTVAKKQATVTADNKTATKGEQLPELTYTVDGLVGDDVIEATLSTSAKNTNTVKDYPITVKVTVKNYPNYDITLVNGTLSVIDKVKQNVTVIANVPADLTYGDEGFKVDVEYGEVVTDAPTTFASSNEAVATVDAEGNVTVVGAGKAVITVAKAGNDTVADFKEEIEVVVEKKAITVTAVDNQKKVDNDDPKLTYVVTGELVGDDAFTGNVEREDGEDVGEYDILIGSLVLSNGDNYDIDFVKGTFTIFDKTPQNIELTANYSKTYGDAPFALDVVYGEENVADGETAFASSNEAVATVDAEGNVTVVGAGKAKITVTRAGNEDLADFAKDVTVTVAKKAIKVTADSKTMYVGEETPQLTYTTDTELVVGDEFTGTLTVADKLVAGKSYDIKIGTLALNDNYKITYVGAKLEVLPKVIQEITLGDLETAIYGDEGFKLEVTYGDFNADAEVVFASSNENVATVDGEGNITILGAGDARISVSVDGNYKYNAFSDDVILTVDKADINFVIHNQVKKIDTEEPEFTYELEGTLYGDTAPVGKPEREAGEELGDYDIKPGTLTVSDPENYNIGYTWGVLTIVDKTPQTVEISGIPAEGITYGDEGFTITATSAEVEGAEVTYESDNENVAVVDENGNVEIKGVGLAVITVTVKGNDDYADAVKTNPIVIEAKEVSVSELDVVNKTFTLDDVLDADMSDVALNFNKLTFVAETVEEGQTPANYVVNGFELVGAKATNYVLSTETMLVPISEDIELADVAPAPEVANGTVEGTGTYLAGSEVTLTAVANKGYKFAGWYVGEEKVSSDAQYTFIADSDVVLTPTFKKSSSGAVGGGGGTPVRTVYFKVDDATVNAVTVDKGQKVVKPEDPAREGYTFAGWFVDEACTEEYDFDKAVDMSFTLYAKWTEVEKQPEEQNPVVWENPYADVAEGNWFYGAVKTATEAGIMKGVSENEFAPEMFVTRAMLVTMLYRAEGEPNVINDVTFKDVDENAYYAGAVTWAYENGIVKGYSETEFAPNADITREQIAAILFRYAGYKGVEAIELSENLFFDDAEDISEYAVAPMNWLVGKEIITGYEDGTVRPQGNSTRAEVAAMAVRMFELFSK